MIKNFTFCYFRNATCNSKQSLNGNYFYLEQDRKLLDKYYRLLHDENNIK